MAIVFVGIDLAKNVFALYGAGEAGRAALARPSVARETLHALGAALPPCTVAMESCSGAHHWARLFQAAGHTVRLIAPKFVTPYRGSHVRLAPGSAATKLRAMTACSSASPHLARCSTQTPSSR